MSVQAKAIPSSMSPADVPPAKPSRRRTAEGRVLMYATDEELALADTMLSDLKAKSARTSADIDALLKRVRGH